MWKGISRINLIRKIGMGYSGEYLFRVGKLSATALTKYKDCAFTVAGSQNWKAAKELAYPKFNGSYEAYEHNCQKHLKEYDKVLKDCFNRIFHRLKYGKDPIELWSAK